MRCLSLTIAVFLSWSGVALAASNVIGLAVTFAAADGKMHATSVSNLALYVAQGESPTPFLPAGRFTGVWEGTVNADLRGEFYFQAELNGALKFEINDKLALEASLTDGVSPLSKAISLNKGANKLKTTYTSPKTGDAYVRLLWTEKGTNTSPIPPQVLRHSLPDGKLELGRALFLEYRCAKCHQEKIGIGVPESHMDAPSFEGIGSRRNSAWMARWILDPKAERSSAHMPKLAKSREEADAMAAFLGTQKNSVLPPSQGVRKDTPTPPEGKT